MELHTLTRAQGANRALVSGEVAPDGHTLVLADEPVLVAGFRRMVRELHYDVAEMAVTTYLTAREHGVRFTALPIPLVRGLHHDAVQVLRGGPVASPRDLVGTRVGVSRGYTVTTGVWARAALEVDGGLDLDSVTWVLSGDEHVQGYHPPENVVAAPPGRDLLDLLCTGDLAAVVGARLDHPDVVALFPDPVDAGLAWVRDRALFPVNHLVVVRDDLLEREPGLARALFEAFAEAKRRYVDDLRAGARDTAQDAELAAVMEVTGGADPLPYGVAPNAAVLEELMTHARRQHILRRPVVVEALFAEETRDLVG